MAYQDLLKFDEDTKAFEEVGKKSVKKKIGTKKDQNRGCNFCPADKVEGLHKVKNLDKLEGKKIMVWAQNPGEEENRKRKELIGPAGKFLWEHAASVGVYREDCDIQNVVRCASGETKIRMADGSTKRLSALVVKKSKEKVLAVNSIGEVVEVL